MVTTIFVVNTHGETLFLAVFVDTKTAATTHQKRRKTASPFFFTQRFPYSGDCSGKCGSAPPQWRAARAAGIWRQVK